MNQPALIVLRPGDKVLVTLAEDASVEDCQTLGADLKRSFRGVEFTILTGVTAVAIEAGADTK